MIEKETPSLYVNLHGGVILNLQILLSGIIYGLQCRFDFLECDFAYPGIPTQPWRCLTNEQLTVDWELDDGSETIDYRQGVFH